MTSTVSEVALNSTHSRSSPTPTPIHTIGRSSCEIVFKVDDRRRTLLLRDTIWPEAFMLEMTRDNVIWRTDWRIDRRSEWFSVLRLITNGAASRRRQNSRQTEIRRDMPDMFIVSRESTSGGGARAEWCGSDWRRLLEYYSHTSWRYVITTKQQFRQVTVFVIYQSWRT